MRDAPASDLLNSIATIQAPICKASADARYAPCGFGKEVQVSRLARFKSKTAVIGIACGALCALCVFLYLQEVNGNIEAARAEALARYGGDQLEICTAAHDLPVGTVISEADVQTKLWVVDLLPADAVRSYSEVAGRQVTSPILKGEVISSKRFEDQAFSIEVPSGMSAVSVPAKVVQAVGGAIVPGMKVDVYSTGDTTTTRIGEGMLVLATSASTSGNIGDSAITWITLAVEPQAVQEFVIAAQETSLYFALPNSMPGGDRSADGTGGASGDANPGNPDNGDSSKSASSGDSGTAHLPGTPQTMREGIGNLLGE